MTGRAIGVLGGMGPAATLDFLAKVLRATPAARDQDHIRLLIDLNPEVPDRNAAIAGLGPSPAPVLAAMARGLEQAGAQALVMVCNSAHAYSAEVRAAVTIPLISLIEETVAEVRARHPQVRTVGLLAASAALDAQVYQRAFADEGVAVRAPEGPLRERFMALLYRIKAGETGAASRAEMAAIAQALVDGGVAHRRAEVVVSGCTEVPLVLEAGDVAAPLVDSTDVLVARTIAFARG